MELTIEMAFKIFNCGVDFGQLKSEEERDKEDLFSGFLGYKHSRETAMPLNEIKRREPHSENWRNAKRLSFEQFKDIIRKLVR